MRPSAMRPVLAAAVFVTVGVALVATTPLAHADVLKVGDRLAELDVATDAAGKPFKLKSLKGKWVVVTVGAAWCKPCAKELPTWDKLAGELKGKVTFISLGVDDEVDDWNHFVKKLKIKNMTPVHLPQNKSGVAGSYGAETMPTTFIIDKQGVVRWVKQGFEEGDASGELKKMKDQLAK